MKVHKFVTYNDFLKEIKTYSEVLRHPELLEYLDGYIREYGYLQFNIVNDWSFSSPLILADRAVLLNNHFCRQNRDAMEDGNIVVMMDTFYGRAKAIRMCLYSK